MITERHKELTLIEVQDFIKEVGSVKAKQYYTNMLNNNDFSHNTATKGLIEYKIGLIIGLTVNGKINPKEIKIKDSEYSVKDDSGKKIEFGSYIPLSQFGK